MRLAPALLATALAGSVAAQEWVFLDVPSTVGRAVAYDSRRARTVMRGIDGETWEFAGNTPLHRSTPIAPFARNRSAMTYDAARGQVLLFGGNAPNALGDTWLWDGCSWQQPFLVVTPPRRCDAALTFDSRRNRVVMFGGADLGIVTHSDTWEWDGVQWLQQAPATVPNPIESPVLAFDSVRGVSVLVTSPRTGTQPVAVFEWNGVDWLPRASTTTPPAQRLYANLAYDPLRQRTVLFGSFNAGGNQIWEWDGNAWQQMATATFAPFMPAMYFDPALAAVVIVDSQLDGLRSSQTTAWKWDGVSLSNHWTGFSPLPCQGFALFQDTARNRTVLHGGRRSTTTDETWEWDGVQWTARTPTNRPPAREEATACFDPVTATGLLFGGLGPTSALADSWRWNGSNWTQLTVAAPPPRYESAMVWDPGRSEAILFGGLGNSAWLGDTWRWNGSAWTQVVAVPAPSPRSRHAFAFDPLRGRTVLFGGRFNGPSAANHLNDTWEWNGTQWQQVLTAQSPPPLIGSSLVHDPVRGRMRLIGLEASNPFLPVLHEWEYDGTNWSLQGTRTSRLDAALHSVLDPLRQRPVLFSSSAMRELTPVAARVDVLGNGCGAPPPLLAARSRPRTGEPTFGLESWSRAMLPVLFAFAFGQGSTPVGNGCTLLLQPVATTTFVLADASGLAALPIALPANQALRGLVVFAQAGALDPAAPGGFALSHALRLTIGD